MTTNNVTWTKNADNTRTFEGCHRYRLEPGTGGRYLLFVDNCQLGSRDSIKNHTVTVERMESEAVYIQEAMVELHAEGPAVDNIPKSEAPEMTPTEPVVTEVDFPANSSEPVLVRTTPMNSAHQETPKHPRGGWNHTFLFGKGAKGITTMRSANQTTAQPKKGKKVTKAKKLRGGTGGIPQAPKAQTEPSAPPKPKLTGNALQQFVNEAVDKFGCNFPNRADDLKYLADHGVEREQVTDQMIARADRYVREKLYEAVEAHNAKNGHILKATIPGSGHPTLDPARVGKAGSSSPEPYNPTEAQTQTEETEVKTFAVEKEKIAEALAAMGKPTAVDWTVKRLEKRLNDLPSLLSEVTPPKQAAHKRLFASITKAVEEGQKITVTAGGAPEAPKEKPSKAEANGSHKEPKAKKEKESDKGPSNKGRVWQIWSKKPSTTPDELATEVDNAVKVSTVRGWLSSWKAGRDLPKLAKA